MKSSFPCQSGHNILHIKIARPQKRTPRTILGNYSNIFGGSIKQNFANGTGVRNHLIYFSYFTSRKLRCGKVKWLAQREIMNAWAKTVISKDKGNGQKWQFWEIKVRTCLIGQWDKEKGRVWDDSEFQSGAIGWMLVPLSETGTIWIGYIWGKR